jgi:fructokinase
VFSRLGRKRTFHSLAECYESDSLTGNTNPLIVVGLGELLWDVFPDGKRPGGAPANVAFQAQQLGCYGLVASRVGVDSLGGELVEFLQSKGLQTSMIQRDKTAPTGRVTVSFNTENQPEYIIHKEVAWDKLEFNSELEAVMQNAAAVCFGTLAQRCPTSREAIYKAVATTSEECLRVYDMNIRQDYYDIEWIEVSLHLATILKLNDEEVDLLSTMLDLPADHDQFSKALIEKYNLNLICITRGANGCLVVSLEDFIDIPGEPIEVADTVGAGDAFTAGLICSQLSGKNLEESVRFANKIGGIVAAHHGAMPDLVGEFSKLTIK